MLNNQQRNNFSVRKMSILAMFTAISIILTRFLVIHPMPSVRIEFGNVPIMLAGFMFGPFSGIIVGAAADCLGAMLRGQGFDVPLMLVPMFMGGVAGLARNYVLKNPSYLKVLAVTLPVNIIGKMLWTTYWLSAVIVKAPFMAILPTRVIVYSIVPIVEAALLLQLVTNIAFKKLVYEVEK
jgi:signal transduction histidine kinase, lytS